MVPSGFLHDVGDSSAVAFVGEEDLTAKLVVTRRAWDWGLAMPTLSLPGVFAGRSVADPRPVVLEAWSAPDTLRLSATSAAFTGSRAMALTPVIGWALIQTVFSIGGNFELLAHICWLAALMVPIGWWGIQAAARSGRVLGIAVLKVVIQVVAGRNIAVLVEAAVRNTILQLRGIDTYQEFVERHRKAMGHGAAGGGH